MPRQAFLLALCSLSIASLAAAKDPLNRVQGTEDWSAPDKGTVRDSPRQRQLQRELADREEVEAFFATERESFKADQAAFNQIVARREAARGLDSAPARRSQSHRSAQPASVNVAKEDAALEAEARRLEERATRNLEQAEGLAPAAPAPQTPPARRASKSAAIAHETAAPAEEDTATSPSARELAQERRRAEAEAAQDAADQREQQLREAKERKKQAEEDRARRAEDDRQRAREAELRRAAEERRRVDEANRAAAEAKAAERKAAEDSAKNLGGKLDKDGQFVDPDIDK